MPNNFVIQSNILPRNSIIIRGLGGGNSFNVNRPIGVTSSLWSPMFLADFGTALGTSSAAIGDGGVFDTFSPDYSQNGEVVLAEPTEGWLTPNMLKVYSATGIRNGYLEPKHTTLGTQAENEIRHYRFSIVIKAPTYASGATDVSHHGIQDGYPVGSGTYQNWSLTDVTGNSTPATDNTFLTQWQARVIINGPDQFELDSTVTPTKLNKHEKYTFDYQIIRGSGANSGSFQIRVWLYNNSGSLIKSPSDWKSSNWSGETMASGRWYPFNNLDSTTSVGFGLNGILGTFPLYHSNQGEIAVVSSLNNPSLSSSTSIGIYGSCQGET